MLIVMKRGASQEQVDAVVARIEARGMTARPIPGGERVAVAVLYNTGTVEESAFLELPGVKEAIAVTKPYKLVSRETQTKDTEVRVGSAVIGNSSFTTIDEWLMAAEYLMEEGNTQVVLCERGVRTFVRHSRNTLDLSAVPVVRKESHLPILVDPSHAAGRRDQVIPLSRASMVVGAHGIMVEVHHAPEDALSDGAQSLYPEQFQDLQNQLGAIARLSFP